MSRKVFCLYKPSSIIDSVWWGLRVFVFILALPVFADTPAERETRAPIKSESDDRNYAYQVLENGLKVLLISDPETDKAAAALDVWIGSGEDPEERPGLAHFLEHMLFLGTEKYPEADEYQQFISSRGGSHNAYTTLEHTNYYFDISAEHLEAALDRFSQFFIAPLFNEKYVDRERNAVDSEYRAKYQSEYLRMQDVLRELVRQDSSLAKFNVGSLDTLSNKNGDLRKSLVSFYEKYYSADRMSLVVIGRESITDLRKQVISRFAAIPKRQPIQLDEFSSPFPKGFLPAQVTIKPLKDLRQLQIMFPLPANPDYHKKSLQYIGHLLAHEGSGSLLSALKTLGLAESLWAGESSSWRGGRMFSVHISLTQKGENSLDEIETLLYRQLDNIAANGIESWRYQELVQQGIIEFRFREKFDAMKEARALAHTLHDTGVEDILRRAYVYSEFDKAEISRYLGKLNRENSLRVHISQSVNTDKVSQHFEAPYRVASQKNLQIKPHIKPQIKNMPASSEGFELLTLPEKNLFIPNDLSIKPYKQTQKIPEVIYEKGNAFSAWYVNNGHFDVPRAEIRLRVKSAAVANCIKGYATAKVFASAFNDSLNEMSYLAAMAGSHFSVSANARGIDLEFSGYSDGVDVLFEKVIDALRDAQNNQKLFFKAHRIEEIKERLVRNERNQRHQAPYRQLLRMLPVFMYQPYWAPDDIAEAISGVTLAEVESFAETLRQGSEVKMLMSGNIQHRLAKTLAKKSEKALHKIASDKRIVPSQITKLPSALGVLRYEQVINHNDHAMILYVQGQNDSLEERAKILLLSQILGSPYYNQLRTEKQLGYIVSVSQYPLRDVPALTFLVQSPTTRPSKILQETNKFLLAFQDDVASELSTHKQALISALQEKPKNLRENTEQLWTSILLDDSDFNRIEELVSAVNDISEQDVKMHYEALLLGAKQKRFMLTTKGGESDNIAVVNNVTDPQAFKKRSAVYIYP